MERVFPFYASVDGLGSEAKMGDRNLSVVQTWILTIVLAMSATRAVAQAAPPSDETPTPPAPSATPDVQPAPEAAPAPPPAEVPQTAPPPPPTTPAMPTPSEAAAGAPATGPEATAAQPLPPLAPVDTGFKDLGAPGPAAEEINPIYDGSHIRRMRLMPDDVLVVDSPLPTDVQGRDYLQMRRQLSGPVAPDTTAALGHSKGGGPNTDLLLLRQQPTLILLNGRRLIAAPYQLDGGADYIDVNQIPLQLIERVESTRGMTSGLYGDGAVGGTVNFVTRRDLNGVEVELGGQTTDRFDQSDEDISLTLGTNGEDSGINAMVSYFNRSNLPANDRSWINDRTERVESLLGSPASFQPSTNFNFPFPDPSCGKAIKQGYASSVQVRLPGYFGPPSILGQLPADKQQMLLMNQDVALGNGNGTIEPGEAPTYCATDFTSTEDLILKDQRIQTYSTFWHKFSSHTEGFGELGYYRSDNQNRTAPSFPIIRLTADVNNINPVWVPADHADQPVEERGFAAAEVAQGRVPQNQFIVGRIDGIYAGSNLNKRSVDVFRGVLGIKGDLKDISKGSILDSWDWALSGVFSQTDQTSTVPDTLMDNLATALHSCPKTKMDQDRNPVPTTIKDRQEMGCYNPFYSSVTNSVALDPLNLTNKKVSSQNGFIASDTDKPGQPGYGTQDGGYICDPNDPNSPPCPGALDPKHDGSYELAGTPNTKQVIDRLMGEQTTITRRQLGTIDGSLQGDITKFDRGNLSFGLGGQFRRETLGIDYDQAYNQKEYGFLFGAPDVPNAGRNIGAGYGELRLRLLDGMIELQPAARFEHYQRTGSAFSPLVGLMFRPFAVSPTPPKALEWLIFHAHLGRGYRAPSLMQMYGSQIQFDAVEFFGTINYVPHAISGNPDLNFEKYTTVGAGVQYDFAGIHVGLDYWTTQIKNMIGADNAQTLMHDCETQYNAGQGDCKEQVLLSGSRILDHIESTFDNLASVSTNGLDGGASYTFDSKKRGVGDFGTFVLGVQGTFLNSYLIDSPRALREYYRVGTEMPDVGKNGVRNYSKITAQYEAAGYRNVDNFAPPLPKLRFSVPLRWLYDGHIVGLTMRYIGGYHDDSEMTIERYNLPNIGNLAIAEGESIPAWVVFDANYGYTFDVQGRKIRVTVGVINLLDKQPPAVESPLGYEVGLTDPRGRIIYARVAGRF